MISRDNRRNSRWRPRWRPIFEHLSKSKKKVFTNYSTNLLKFKIVNIICMASGLQNIKTFLSWKVKVNVTARSNCVICIQKAIVPHIFICRLAGFCNNSLKTTPRYRQNYYHSIGAGFSQIKANTKTKRWPQRCAPCSAQNTQIRNLFIMFNKTAALLKKCYNLFCFTQNLYLHYIYQFLILVFWAEQGSHLWGHLICLCVSFNLAKTSTNQMMV